MVLDVDIQHDERARHAEGLGVARFGTSAAVNWCGASGTIVPCAAYSLIDCPAFADAVYLLIRRVPGGEPTVLAIDVTDTSIATLNLARVRHDGARLGADEVHVHAVAATRAARIKLRLDLLMALRARNGTARHDHPTIAAG